MTELSEIFDESSSIFPSLSANTTGMSKIFVPNEKRNTLWKKNWDKKNSLKFNGRCRIWIQMRGSNSNFTKPVNFKSYKTAKFQILQTR
jgi:hypothetical protein